MLSYLAGNNVLHLLLFDGELERTVVRVMPIGVGLKMNIFWTFEHIKNTGKLATRLRDAQSSPGYSPWHIKYGYNSLKRAFYFPFLLYLLMTGVFKSIKVMNYWLGLSGDKTNSLIPWGSSLEPAPWISRGEGGLRLGGNFSWLLNCKCKTYFPPKFCVTRKSLCIQIIQAFSWKSFLGFKGQPLT